MANFKWYFIFWYWWNVCKFVIGTDFSSIPVLPTLKWKTATMDRGSAAACIVNFNNKAWIFGGKETKTDTDVSISARILQFNSTLPGIVHTIRKEIEVHQRSSYLGSSMAINGLYCTSQHMTAYVTKDDEANSRHINKICVISANDGRQNRPMCYCCDNLEEWFISDEKPQEKALGKLVCTDLWENKQCPSLFDSCIINDIDNNRIIQIGGNSGIQDYDSIVCLDSKSETYSKNVHRLASLTSSNKNKHDPACPYGRLAISHYGSGCELFKKKGTIVVAGGRRLFVYSPEWTASPDDTFSNAIQICQNDGRPCRVSKTLQFPYGIAHVTTVLLDDECLFMTLGGHTVDGPIRDIWIANLCTERWLYHGENALPDKMTEFSLVKTDQDLCILGGQILTPDEMYDLADKVYCISLNQIWDLVADNLECHETCQHSQPTASLKTEL